MWLLECRLSVAKITKMLSPLNFIASILMICVFFSVVVAVVVVVESECFFAKKALHDLFSNIFIYDFHYSEW